MKDNERGLKEGGGIKILTTVLFHIRDARSLSLFVIFTYLVLLVKFYLISI